MKWIFIGVWIIAVSSTMTFVWITQSSNKSKDNTFYTTLVTDNLTENKATVFGKIFYNNEYQLVPTSEGYVTNVWVKPGDIVKKGQELASLDLQEGDLKQYNELKKIALDTGPIERLNKMLKEISHLETKGFYDPIEGSKKRAEIYSNLNQLMNYKNSLQKQFDLTYGKILYSPFDGVVTDVRLRAGMRYSLKDDKNETAIFVAPKGAHPGIELEISDELLHKVKIGDKINVRIPLTNIDAMEGEIIAVSSQVYDDKKKRFYKVIGEIKEYINYQHLASGMRVVIDIDTKSEDNWIWIPKAALDINLKEKNISGTLDYSKNHNRSIASKASSYKNDNKDESLDENLEPSQATMAISNELFPNESNKTEVYILTSDEKVIKVSVTKVSESGELVAIQGKDLVGMKIITHYRPAGWIW